MTEREFEERLRSFYRAEVEAAVAPPAELRHEVLAIPDDHPFNREAFGQRRTLILLVAAMLTAALLGGALAYASGLLRLPWLPDERETVIHPLPSGLMAYVVALTDWNTPGGPTFESPGSPTRIAFVRAGESSPVYVGGVVPPTAGAPADEWLSVRQQCPTFSPDGLWLAYVEAEPSRSSVGGDRAELVIARVDDLALAVEIEFRIPAMHFGGCPVWSPDGTQIAFERRGETIAIADLEGTTHDLTVPDHVAQIVSYAWSPDGASIAIIDLAIPIGSSPHGRLWLVPMDEREAQLLYEPGTMLGSALSWSADGSEIAITSAFGPASPDLDQFTPSYGSDWMVHVVDVDSGAAQAIGRGYGPSWAPTGEQLAYLANPARGGQNAETGTVVVVDMAAESEWVIPAAPIPPGTPLSDYNWEGGTGFWQPHEPRWSPDGTSLLFVGSDGIWGTSVLLAATATGQEIPTAVSATWVAEWYGQNPMSWQIEGE